jgi:hypothetical protein
MGHVSQIGFDGAAGIGERDARISSSGSRCRGCTMSDEFDNLDANEKAAVESTLYRCRALVGRIGEELRKKKPEHFVDDRSLADLHASLEHAAWVLEQKTAKGLQERSHQRHR